MPTLTFLLTDIEASTARWEAQPAAMSRALERHDEILRTVVSSHGGRVLKGVGDGLWALFDDASAAVTAAVEAQRAIRDEDWGELEALRIRIALHAAPSSEVQERGGDLFGPPMNRCARLVGVAHAGQIVASDAVRAAVGSTPDGVALRDLGIHRLRDLAEPERVHQVLADDLPGDFPPLTSLDAFPHNLPMQRTSFVGRDDDVAQLVDLLTDHRLVTLIGTGGGGKTRLALAVAAELVGAFRDGVWLVDLAVLRDPQLVAHVVADVLGVRDQPARPLVDVLQDFLRERETLLVLDNCEHLVAAVAELADALLAAAPATRMLVTSRERLDVAGEVVHPVQPLPVGDATSRGDAVELFLDRTRAVASDLDLDDDDLEDVAAICRRLDGIPLALELAASRLAVLSPRELLTRLDDRFRLLTGGARTAVPHHQTLRATLEWSHDLLEDDERALFRRMGVFAGMVPFEAVEAVAAGDDLPASEVLDLLGRLVAKSLVTVDRGSRGTRYGMLETVREYAAERLLEAGEAAACRDAHARWVLEISQRMRPDPRVYAGEHERPVRDHDVRAALGWLEAHAPLEAVTLATTFADLWWMSGKLGEARQHLERSLEAAGADLPRGARLRAVTGLASITVSQGDLDAAERYATEVVEAGGAHRSTVICLWTLGTIAWARGQLDEARRAQERGTELARELGFHHGERFHLNLRARIHLTAGELDRAEELYLEERHGYTSSGDEPWIGGALDGLARVALRRGDAERAIEMADDALERYESAGYVEGTASALTVRGLAALAAGDHDAARADLTRALELNRRMGHRGGLASTLDAFASLHAATGDDERAARLLGVAGAIRAELGEATASDLDHLTGEVAATLEQRLGDRLTSLREEGRRLPPDVWAGLATGAAVGVPSART